MSRKERFAKGLRHRLRKACIGWVLVVVLAAVFERTGLGCIPCEPAAVINDGVSVIYACGTAYFSADTYSGCNSYFEWEVDGHYQAGYGLDQVDYTLSPGIYTVTLWVANDEWSWDCDTAQVCVGELSVVLGETFLQVGQATSVTISGQAPFWGRGSGQVGLGDQANCPSGHSFALYSDQACTQEIPPEQWSWSVSGSFNLTFYLKALVPKTGGVCSTLWPHNCYAQCGAAYVLVDVALDGVDAAHEDTPPGMFVPRGGIRPIWLEVGPDNCFWYGETVTLDVTNGAKIDNKVYLWDCVTDTWGQAITLPHTFEPYSEFEPGTWGGNIYTHRIRLGVEGVIPSDSPGDVCFTLTDDESGLYDSAVVSVVDLDILEVPEYLFASATYAAPIKFRVLGMGNNVEITKIVANLTGRCLAFYQDLGQRFVAGSGTSRGNGTSDTYTCFYPHWGYMVFPGDDFHRTDTASFGLEVRCGVGGQFITLNRESQSDPEAKIKMYCDPALVAVEPGIYSVNQGGIKVHNISLTSGTEAEVSEFPKASYQHIGGKMCSGVFPHEEPESQTQSCIGMQRMWHEAEDRYIAHASGDQMLIETRLFDGSDYLKDPFRMPAPIYDETCKARIYGNRRGGYFLVSYGGRVLDPGILEPGEYAMDLGKTSGNVSWTFVDGGRVQFTNTQITPGGLSVAGVVSNVFAVLSVVSYKSPPTAIAFGIISELFDLIDDIDLDTPNTNGKAEGVLYRVVQRYQPGAGPITVRDVTFRDYEGEGSWIELNLNADSKACNAGDQYTIYPFRRNNEQKSTRDKSICADKKVDLVVSTSLSKGIDMAFQRILTLDEGQLAELQHERIHHDHPRVRQRMDAVWLRAHGMTQLHVAEMLGISRHTIAGYENLYEAGGLAALKDCNWGSRVSPLQAYADQIEAYLEEHPPRTLEEACDLIEERTGIRREKSFVREFLHRLGIRRLKTGMMPAKADPQEQEAFLKKT